ncbi:MAG TPA: endonuclease domain-containing protein [Bacteroidia bacterium]|jgi:very-short-patch-repair endonuclease|nr:endonuclease domain-containing protein [Bacteroidia bacterium]
MFDKSIKTLCRDLRKNQTEEEDILWQNIRNRKLNGLKFLRQHPIVYDRFKKNTKFFIADFYCAEKNLIVELDGKIHNFQKEYDENRDLIIQSKGIKVLRFKNEEVKDIVLLLNKIRKEIL